MPNSNTRGKLKSVVGYAASGARTAVDMMRRNFGFNRDQVEGAVAHPPFGRKFFGESSHIFCMATQDDGFQAIVMIEVDVHRGHHQIVCVMLQIGEALAEPAFMVVVHVGQAGDAMRGFLAFQSTVFQLPPDHVPYSFGTIGVTTVVNQAIESLGKRLVERDGEAFHGGAVSVGARNRNVKPPGYQELANAYDLHADTATRSQDYRRDSGVDTCLYCEKGYPFEYMPICKEAKTDPTSRTNTSTH